MSSPTPTSSIAVPFAEDANVPALTTRYTYSSQCRDRYLLANWDASPLFAFSVRSLDASRSDYLWPSCQPFGGQSSYSPGVCPEGFNALAIGLTIYTSSMSVVTRYQAQCCKSGMSMSNGRCASQISEKLGAYVAMTFTTTEGSTQSVYEEYFVLRNGRSGTPISSSLTTISAGYALAQPLSIAWRSSDLSNFPVDYAVSLAQRIGVSFTPTATPGSSLAPSPGSTSNLPLETGSPLGLSTGAKAGIGVGVAIGALLVISLIATFMLIRRRKKTIEANANHNTSDDPPEMADQDQDLAKRKWFLGGRWRSEAEVVHKPNELDSRAVHVVPGPPAELDAVEYRRPGEGATQKQ